MSPIEQNFIAILDIYLNAHWAFDSQFEYFTSLFQIQSVKSYFLKVS